MLSTISENEKKTFSKNKQLNNNKKLNLATYIFRGQTISRSKNIKTDGLFLSFDRCMYLTVTEPGNTYQYNR